MARTAKTVSLETALLREIEETKGDGSTSERVNQLLKTGLEAERRCSLYEEAEEFFQSLPDDRKERRAFQAASIRAISRD